MTSFDSADRYEYTSQEDRCAPRTKLIIPATFRPSGGRAYQTMVNDLSLGGFCCTAVNRHNPGTICWITLPGLESLQSEVVWWDNNLIGCAFANLLSPVVHDNILARWQPDVIYRKTP